MTNFADWTLAALEYRFGLDQRTNIPALQTWQDASGGIDIDADERLVLHIFQQRLAHNLWGWNEQELALNFIGPIISLVNFTTPHINFFAGRSFQAEVDGELMAGKPDGMIAQGRKEPHTPYFCFQEYKKNIDPNGDPFGQCLAAMLAAQALNGDNVPVYGLVVVGNNWSFMALQNREYSISDSLSSLGPDIFRIFALLKALRAAVMAHATSAVPANATQSPGHE